MNKKQRAAVMAMTVLSALAQAALTDRGGGMIYDDVKNITWLADMNYARTSGFDADGLMDWTTAKSWASNLSYGGFDDWRLPATDPSDTNCSIAVSPPGFSVQHMGYNCTGTEMGNLFINELGEQRDTSVLNTTGDTAQQVANLALFMNVQSFVYWSGTEYAPDTESAWLFLTDRAYQSLARKTNVVYAVAVRDGDVPEPTTLALVGAALLGVAATRRRKVTVTTS